MHCSLFLKVLSSNFTYVLNLFLLDPAELLTFLFKLVLDTTVQQIQAWVQLLYLWLKTSEQPSNEKAASTIQWKCFTSEQKFGICFFTKHFFHNYRQAPIFCRGSLCFKIKYIIHQMFPSSMWGLVITWEGDKTSLLHGSKDNEGLDIALALCVKGHTSPLCFSFSSLLRSHRPGWRRRWGVKVECVYVWPNYQRCVKMEVRSALTQ